MSDDGGAGLHRVSPTPRLLRKIEAELAPQTDEADQAAVIDPEDRRTRL